MDRPPRVDLTATVVGPEDGFPVVLLHGFPLSRHMWRHQEDALQRAGYRVISPDLRGHGTSHAPDAPASLEDMAADVEALLDRLGVHRFVLGGFSMGGYVAFELWRRAHGRIPALMLVDTRAEPDSEDARRGRMETARKVRAEGMRVLEEAMMPKLLTERTRREHPALVDEVHNLIHANPPAGAAQALHAMASRHDQRPILKEILLPTLVIVGAEDPITPPDAARAMVSALPAARLEIIPHAAHLAPMENPEAVNRVMLDWLAKVEP